MPSIRLQQVQETVKRAFSLVLQQEGRYVYQDAFVTVTKVEVSPDLSTAKIYVSVYNTDNKQAVILQMEDNHHRLKQELSHRLRRHVRRIPEFTVYLDETLDEMYRLNHLFDKLHDDNQMGDAEE